jgi:hypothetical protein
MGGIYHDQLLLARLQYAYYTVYLDINAYHQIRLSQHYSTANN